MYGYRRSISTYARDISAAARGDATRGSVSQNFTVPNDAVALRFNVHGGMAAQIKLLYQNQALYSVTGNDADAPLVIVNWALQAQRGKNVRLSIENSAVLGPFGYVGSSGFDLITSYNGP
jgi:hypothetical protein